MAYETIIYNKKEGIADIILNRPDKFNAVSFQMVSELQSAFLDAEADEKIDVIILSGAGDNFTSGDDIGAKDMKVWYEWSPGQIYVRMRKQHYYRLIGLIRNLTKPVIAQLQGYCLGSGPELAIACDLIVAADTTKFGIYRGLALLPRVVGYHKAIELVTMGEEKENFINAEEAARIGMVNQVVPREQLRGTVMKYAEMMAKRKTMGWIKWVFNRALDSNSVDEAVDFNAMWAGLTHISKYLPNPKEMLHQ